MAGDCCGEIVNTKSMVILAVVYVKGIFRSLVMKTGIGCGMVVGKNLGGYFGFGVRRGHFPLSNMAWRGRGVERQWTENSMGILAVVYVECIFYS